MLEGIASSILTKYLGDYIEGLDKNNLNISITSGDVVLTNMRLKKSALKDLELPVEVKEGFLRKLTLKIPWKSIGSQPAIIKIEGVYIIASPKKGSRDSIDEEKNRRHASKLQQLQIAELLGLDKPSEDEPKKKEKKDEGFFGRLTMKVVDNIQIYIDNIHIRFEDEISNPKKPFTVGITLDSLYAQSTDENWKPTFLTVGADIVHKLVTLSNLAVYFNTSNNDQFLKFSSIEEMAEKLDALIPNNENQENLGHHYILKPISGVLKAQIDRGENLVLERPKVLIRSELESFTVSINSSQFKRLMDVSNYVEKFYKILEHIEYKPPSSVRPRDDPIAWWKYAYECVVHKAKKKREAWKWENIENFIKYRTSYIKLFKEQIKVTLDKMKPESRKELESLERILNYDDIITFRKLAYASCKKEELKNKERGFFSRFFGSKPTEIEANKSEALKELYSAIGYDESSEQSNKESSLPPDYVNMQFDFHMNKGSFELRRDDKNNDIPLGSFNFHNLKSSVLLREKWKTFKGNLETIEFLEYHTLKDKPLAMLKPDMDSNTDEAQDFMTVQFDLNPLNTEKPLDLLLKIDSKPLFIYFSKSFIDTLVNFFKIDSNDNIEKIAQAASAGFDSLKKRAETGLKYTIDQKKKMLIDIHLDAPKIICPKDFNDPHTPSIILDLGKINFTSNPYSKEKGIEKIDQTEISVSEDYFYDQFNINLEGLNALAISGKETSWTDIKSLDHRSYSVIDKFDFDVLLKICNEESSELPKIKIATLIKSVSLNITQPRVSAIMEVIDSITASSQQNEEKPPKQIESPKEIEKVPKSVKSSKKVKRRTVDLYKEEKSKVVQAPKKKEEVYSPFLDLDFELGSFSAGIYEFKELATRSSEEEQKPLATFYMNMLHFKFNQSNFDFKFDMTLKSISIQDRGQDHNFLLMTEQDDSNIDLIDIKYIGIPQHSPLYKDVDHEMAVKFGKLIININRPTVAGLLQTINNISLSFQKKEPESLPQDNVTEEEIKLDESSKSIQIEKTHSIYKLQASLHSVQINLNRKSDTFARFTLNKSHVSMDVKNDNNLFIEGYLGSISLYDPHVIEKWSNIISVKNSNEMIKFSFFKYDKKSKDYPGYDMNLDLKMNSLKYIYLNKNIKELTDYFSGFDRMRSLISAASYYYYSASIDAIKDAAKNVTKFKFNIEIRNPQIIVPLSSKNKNHLIMNLGNIHLNNSFVENHGYEIDNIRVRIINFNTQSNIFNDDINTFDKDDIILNTNTEVLIERALYPEEVKGRPEIDIKMNIPSFGITISESQISLLFSMLSQNIGEEITSDNDEEIQLVIEALKTVNYNIEAWKYEYNNEDKTSLEELTKKMKIRLQFRLSKVYLKALKGNGYDKDSNLQDEVFQLKVNKILSEVETYSDSSLYFRVDLNKAFLEDTRNKTDVLFKRIWAPKDDDQSKTPQFSFIYESNPLTHFTSMKTTLYQPQLTLVPETLTEVYQYLMRSLQKVSSSNSKQESQQTEQENLEGEKNETEDKRNVMKMEISIISPEICVVENAYIQQTPSFVLHLGNSSVNMLTSPDSMKLGLNLDSFDMYRCILDSNDLKARKDISKVLQPITIEANLGRNEEGIKRISADLGIINTIISFSDIKRLLIIYKSYLPLIEVMSSQPSEEQNIEPKEQIDENNQPLIEEKKEDQEEKSEVSKDEELIQLVDDEPTEEAELEIDEAEKGPIDTQIIVSLKSIYMTLLNDRISTNSYPALKLSIENNEAMVTLYKEGAQEVYFTVETLEMSSYNNLVAAIEPVIEPWSMNLVYEKYKEFMKIHVEAQEVLDFNITKSLLDTLFSIQDLIKEINGEVWKGNKEVKKDIKQVYFDPYIIRNNTLNKISFITSNIQSIRQNIGPNEEVPLITAPSNRSVASERPTKYFIDVEFPDDPSLEPIKNIPVSKVGKQCYFLKGYDVTEPLIVEVEDSNGTKIITFRSSIKIINEFKETIEFGIFNMFANSIAYTTIIKPNESFNIPLNMVANSIYYFRPYNKDYEWCKCNKSNDSKEYYCRNEKTNKLWVCSLSYKSSILYFVGLQSIMDRTITIRPALVIENALCTNISLRLKEKNSNFIAFEDKGLKPMDSLDIYEFNHSDNVDIEELNADFTLSGKYNLEVKVDGFEWSSSSLIKDKDFKVELKDTHESTLELKVECKSDKGLRKLVVYAPYWIINHTGLNLFYKKPKSTKEAAGQKVISESYTPQYADNDVDPSNWYSDDLYTIHYDYGDNRFMYDSKRICIKVDNSPWSKDLPLGVKNEGLVTIQDTENTYREYQFLIKVEPAPGVFWRTNIVRLYPANILVNKTSTTLLYKQSSTSYVYKIGEDQSIPFHWPIFKDSDKKISFSDGKDDIWSPDISIQTPGSFKVKLKTIYTESNRILDIIIKVIDGVTFIIVGDGTKDVTKVISYQIVNRSDYNVIIEQKDSPTRFTLGAKEETLYCWDEPQYTEPRLLISASKDSKGDKKVEIDLDVITNANEIQYLDLENGRKLRLEVKPNGDTKTLLISNMDDVEELKTELIRALNFQFTLSMRGIGVSVIDETPQELLYITFQTIYMDFQTSNIDKTFEFSIGAAQIDNQLYNNPLPILLYSTPVENSPFFHLSLIQNTTTERVQFFKYFAVKLQEIDLNIDESLIIRMLAFLEKFIEHFSTLDQEEKIDKLLNDVNHDIPKIKDEDISSLNIYYFELFHINPIRVNVTYMANPVHDDIVLNAVQVQKILGYIGKLTNIEKAPLELNCLILEHPYCSKDDLVGRVIKHYTNAAIKQAYLILGSADFLGNPVSLFTNLGTGFKDFFYEPAKGIVKSPKDFGVGLAKGTKSLLKKTIYGLFDTASKLTGTVAKVGTNLTFDSEYQKERSIRNQTKARHAGEGLAYGVRDFGIGLFKGITGVVVQPIKGVKKEGALGFFKGVGKGVAGIVLKPTIGAVDLITRTTEGIKNTTTYFDEKLKIPIRPPRYIPDEGVVVLYNFEKSLGLQVFKALDSKKLKHEKYVNHVLLEKGKFLMVTTFSILFIDQAIIRLGHQWVIDWKAKINKVIDIQLDERGKSIYVIEKKNEEKKITHKVPCSNIEETRLCYQLLIHSGIKLQPLDEEKKKDVETMLGHDIFDIIDDEDIDEYDLNARRQKRQRQRKQKYANERTKLLGGGEKHDSCSECCESCCNQCTIQ